MKRGFCSSTMVFTGSMIGCSGHAESISRKWSLADYSCVVGRRLAIPRAPVHLDVFVAYFRAMERLPRRNDRVRTRTNAIVRRELMKIDAAASVPIPDYATF